MNHFGARATVLALVTFGSVACGGGESRTSATRGVPGVNQQPQGPQSAITGPFVNDPVAPPAQVTALAVAGSTAPLLRAPDPTNSAANTANTPTQTNEIAPPPTVPTPEEPVVFGGQGTGRDALIDGLLGVWADGPDRSVRGSNGWSTSECVLTIRSPTDAREECTTTTRYGDDEQDRCQLRGQTRRRVTASPYTLSVEGVNVRFIPGEPELVSDDLDACGHQPAGRHTYMLSQGWLGSGSVLDIINTAPGGTTGGTSRYRRRSNRR